MLQFQNLLFFLLFPILFQIEYVSSQAYKEEKNENNSKKQTAKPQYEKGIKKNLQRALKLLVQEQEDEAISIFLEVFAEIESIENDDVLVISKTRDAIEIINANPQRMLIYRFWPKILKILNKKNIRNYLKNELLAELALVFLKLNDDEYVLRVAEFDTGNKKNTFLVMVRFFFQEKRFQRVSRLATQLLRTADRDLMLYLIANEYLAREYLKEAVSLIPQITDFAYRGEIYCGLVEYFLAQEDFQRAKELATNIESFSYQNYSLKRIAEVFLEKEDFLQALTFTRQLQDQDWRAFLLRKFLEKGKIVSFSQIEHHIEKIQLLTESLETDALRYYVLQEVPSFINTFSLQHSENKLFLKKWISLINTLSDVQQKSALLSAIEQKNFSQKTCFIGICPLRKKAIVEGAQPAVSSQKSTVIFVFFLFFVVMLLKIQTLRLVFSSLKKRCATFF